MNAYERKLKKLRAEIDRADEALIRALALRMKAVERIGVLKAKNGAQVIQKARWRELMAKRLKQAKKLKLSASLTDGIYKLIHREAIRIQRVRSKKGTREV